MKRALLAAAALLAFAALAGCGGTYTGIGSDSHYRQCLVAGGSYHYDDWTGDETCTLPKAGKP